ncbi:hypothetical protein D3OALGA1CA_5333 [Olavius algarvensis associated proteobacterium Delta 3]|nr:hypothetical protein D3OALGB2SA_4950 [Olavius algarvensis associated proteobacterium Delta 3]CAB5165207.1 hypothetical protein D3OALGA1CA_5333 [Olavius algarvensis associated proteobacterium Delta 3]
MPALPHHRSRVNIMMKHTIYFRIISRWVVVSLMKKGRFFCFLWCDRRGSN